MGVSPLEAGVDVGLHDEVHAEVGAGHLGQLAAAAAVPRLAPAAHRGEGTRAKVGFNVTLLHNYTYTHRWLIGTVFG